MTGHYDLLLPLRPPFGVEINSVETICPEFTLLSMHVLQMPSKGILRTLQQRVNAGVQLKQHSLEIFIEKKGFKTKMS
jgi:hypothetical protein